MPVDLSKYPPNWKTIANQVKKEANWTCEQCDRPCRQPKQSWMDFVEGLQGTSWYEQTCDEVSDDSGLSALIERPQRFTLTVAHLDHDTRNNDRSNLKALCSGCHLRYDAKLHAKNVSATRYRKLEALGQTTLF